MNQTGMMHVYLKAPIDEIFASYQGEGMYVGQPQIFVRFAGCNLHCTYCDTPHTQGIAENQQYVSLTTIVKRAKEKSAKSLSPDGSALPQTVSLTGGEPLLYPSFLSQLLPELKQIPLKTYLETNGTLPEAFARVREFVDIVSMDFKAESACGKKYWDQHREFLALAKGKVFVKMVLSAETTDDEVRAAVKTLRAVSRKIPFVLQPVTPAERAKAIPPARLFKFFTYARKKLDEVQVIPQMHKIWKVR